MAQQPETVGLAKGGKPYQSTGSDTNPVETAPTLPDAGIDKTLANRAPKLAAVPKEEFEERLGVRCRQYPVLRWVRFGHIFGYAIFATKSVLCMYMYPCTQIIIIREICVRESV
jgi:hypothetical protein